jgi:microcin C transport system permease protein
MNWLDPITRRRLERFRHHRAGWWSFLALSTLTLLALLGPLLVGNRPLALQIDGQWRFPVFAGFISAKELGYSGEAEPKYRLLAKQVAADGRGWVLMPPIPFAPDEVSEVMPAVHQDADGRWCEPRGIIGESRIFNLNPDGTRARSWTIINAIWQ